MTSFGWKKKVGDKVSRTSASKFESITGSDVADVEEDDEGDFCGNRWDAFSKKRKLLLLEDAASKSRRLKSEGEILAEAGRFWEAITKWNEALQLTPSNERLHETKAQVLMELHEAFPAVESAQQAVTCNPQWWIAYQTLGRAQLGLGEITMAVKSFSRAIHLNPAEPEVWDEDLRRAWSLQRRAERRKRRERRQGEWHEGKCGCKAAGEEASLSSEEGGSTGVCSKTDASQTPSGPGCSRVCDGERTDKRDSPSETPFCSSMNEQEEISKGTEDEANQSRSLYGREGYR